MPRTPAHPDQQQVLTHHLSSLINGQHQCLQNPVTPEIIITPSMTSTIKPRSRTRLFKGCVTHGDFLVPLIKLAIANAMASFIKGTRKILTIDAFPAIRTCTLILIISTQLFVCEVSIRIPLTISPALKGLINYYHKTEARACAMKTRPHLNCHASLPGGDRYNSCPTLHRVAVHPR